MAEVAFFSLAERDPRWRGRLVVSSAGTARWHVGAPMDPRARRALDRAGYVADGTPAAFADGDYLDNLDLVVVMTREHREDVRARARRPVKVELLRNLVTPGCDLDLADPYFGDDSAFDACLATITEAGRRWIGGPPPPPDGGGSSVGSPAG